MRTLLFIVLLLAVVVLAVGFYRGWFSLETTRDPDSGRSGVKFEIDQKKIRPDIEKVKQRVGGGSGQNEPSPGGQP